MKNLQKNTLKRILEGEQLTASALASTLEIDRGTISKLLNHNLQLSENNWKKVTEAYPEYLEVEAKVEKIKEKVFKQLDKELGLKPVSEKKSTVVKSIKDESNVEQHSSKADGVQKEAKASKNTPEEDAQPKAIKTKEENRHRNLNCPESNYHMKVPYRDLLRARPMCPLTGLPMMLKEEIRDYKRLDENGKKEFIKAIKSKIETESDSSHIRYNFLKLSKEK